MTTQALTIVMYHYVRDLQASAWPRIKGLDTRRFRAQLDFLERNYRLVGYEDIRRHCLEGAPLPERACWLTFDDGYRDHYEVVLPELLARGISGAFFPPVCTVEDNDLLAVNKIHFVLASVSQLAPLIDDLRRLLAEHALAEDSTVKDFDEYWHLYAQASRYDDADTMFVKRMLQYALPENLRARVIDSFFARYVSSNPAGFARSLYMSREELEELVASGMYVGSHGNRHVWLNQISPDEQAKEIDRSLTFLKSIGATDGADWVMCYPYGGYDAHTLSLLRERNCLLGLTTRPAVSNLAENAWLELPRLDTNDLPQI